MPIYEYQCEACSHTFEAIQKMTDAPVATCVLCGGPVRRLLSAPGLVFKGTGWYVTDYAKKGSGDGKEKDGKPSGAGEKDTKETPSKETPSTPPKPSSD